MRQYRNKPLIITILRIEVRVWCSKHHKSQCTPCRLQVVASYYFWTVKIIVSGSVWICGLPFVQHIPYAILAVSVLLYLLYVMHRVKVLVPRQAIIHGMDEFPSESCVSAATVLGIVISSQCIMLTTPSRLITTCGSHYQWRNLPLILFGS